ncbi:LysE family translocator [Glycocaulis abyssi]|uniref:LysE family translocator n=1 Tax=Glycocaulis abyssi TaxID=1433403 RepID=A0ABV9NFW6_9PROT
MTLASLAAFGGALFILFFTPGPGNAAMVARTIDAGPVHGWLYGSGIITGDIVWLTVAVTGLAALAERAGPYVWIGKAIGVAILLWMAWGSLRSGLWPKPPAPVTSGLKRTAGYGATYLAGVAMPLTNPKAILFYLAFLPAFFDLSTVRMTDYAVMVAMMLALFMLTTAVHVTLAERARGWLVAKGVKSRADLATAFVMASVAVWLAIS